VLAIVLGAVYFLVPTFVYFSLPTETRNDKQVFESALPKWAPKKRVNLGLDLQGGVLLNLGVDLDKAVKDKVMRRADELRRYAAEKNLPVAEIKADPAESQVRLAFASPADADNFRKVALEYWNDMHAAGGSGQELQLAFRDDALTNFKDGAIDQALRTIRNRVDSLGVTEPTISKRGADAITVQLPGFKDPEQAKELLGRTAQLEFKIVADDEGRDVVTKLEPLPEGIRMGGNDGQAYLVADDRQVLQNFVQGKAPEGLEIAIGRMETKVPGSAAPKVAYRTWVLRSKTELTGDRLADAKVALDQSQGQNKPYVALSFDKEGALQFEELTGANVQKRLAIVLDSNVDSAPVIQTKIAGGNAQITLGGMKNYNELLKEANDLALVLRSGALPAPVTVLEERSVGASLGPELIRKGSLAALVGLVLVLLFMVAYYKVVGTIADLALVLNGVLLLAAMALAGATLTLPGIAGFVLTLGMAVDANVLINERIREELREGRSVKIAVDNGYGKAFWTIFDSNLTTLIAGVVLLQYGTGPIRGFAVTLIIGLLASMFTALTVTRLVMDVLVRRGSAARLSI
jgi:protein-export membrane protein SecD